MDWRFGTDRATLRVLLRTWNTLVPNIDTGDHNAVLIGEDANDFTNRALGTASSHDHGVTLQDMAWHQTTSEARDTIFM